jgi:hypothetical protein
MSQPRITVISVSWHSAEFLRDLFSRLLALAEQPDTIRLLVADNTGGADAELATLDCPDLTILPVDVGRERMSVAHAIGLNAALSHVDTPYVLITDPDVAVLRSGWDTLLCEMVAHEEVVAAGAPYPGWKLGKYHDFPSPPFAFWRTDALKAVDPDWRPYGRTGGRRFADFVLRQAFWIPRGIDRYVLRVPRRQFRVGRWTERLVGIVSKDTGWEIADRARQRGWQACTFQVVCNPEELASVPAAQRSVYQALATEFELYAWEGRPFVTHRNPTRAQINFNLWTDNNILIYQNRADLAAQTARWRELVAALPVEGSA